MRFWFITIFFLWSSYSLAQCECRYNYGQNLIAPQTVESMGACKTLIGADLSQRYLDHEICSTGGTIEVGWSCGGIVSPARMHQCADIGMGIIRDQVTEVFLATPSLEPHPECNEEEEAYRLRPLLPYETTEESREEFRVKPWKRGVRVRYRLQF